MLGAEDNLQVLYPTTPAQYFHCLRRQVLRRWRKPLVIMTPKSLLRHPKVVSTLDECAQGGFRRVIPDLSGKEPSGIRQIILCAGKVYYELEQQREALKREDIALLRIEQFYPLPKDELRLALQQYPEGTPAVWVQEEPENMGAWRFLRVKLGTKLFENFPFSVVSRPASASPATGSTNSHKQEQARLLAEAFQVKGS